MNRRTDSIATALGAEHTNALWSGLAIAALAALLALAGPAAAEDAEALDREEVLDNQPPADLVEPIDLDHEDANAVLVVCQDPDELGVLCHTDSIQEAIEIAIPGDVVLVADNATYEENLLVDGLEDVHVDASEHGKATLAPPASDVGVTIQNGSNVSFEGLHVDESADVGIAVSDSGLTWSDANLSSAFGQALTLTGGNATLEDVSVTSEGPRAITVSGGGGLDVESSTIESVTGQGIYGAAGQVNVQASTLEQTGDLDDLDTEYAVRLEGSAADGSAFVESTFEGHRHGVLLAGTSDVEIEDNEFLDGGLTGVLVTTGTGGTVSDATGIAIEDNKLSGNGFTGVGFVGTSADHQITDVDVEENNFTDHPQHIDGTFYDGCAEDLSMQAYFEDNDYDRAVLGVNSQGDPDPCKVESSIQDVLDAAADGHEVIVRGGTYEEALTVGDIQGLDLHAFEDEAPVIDGSGFGSGTTLLELAPTGDGTIANVSVSGLTFQNIPVHAGGSASSGQGIAMFTDHVVEDVEIVDNTFDNTEAEDASHKGAAIVIDSVDGLTIEDNVIREAADYTGAVPNEYAAITLHMFLTENSLQDVTVADNEIVGGDTSAFGDRGIWVGASAVSSNVAHPNEAFEGVTIRDNEISDIGREGIRVHAVADDGSRDSVTIENNIIENADRSVRIADADFVTMTDNEITGEGSYAVSLEADARLTSIENTFSGHEAGLVVEADSAVVNATDDEFTGNVDGVLNAAEAFVEIRSATFAENEIGVRNTAVDAVVDARENWWNSPLGPADDDRTIPGVLGQPVEGDVVYRNWCVEPDCIVTASAGVGVDPS